MEHILQFAVSVDDDAIRRICEEKAAEQVIKDVMEFSHESSYRQGRYSENLKLMFAEAIDEYIKEHADEIIKEAVQEVAKNMMKSKRVREALSSVIEE